MHEVLFCEALLERIEAERTTRRFRLIHRVRVEIGCFSKVDPEALETAFELLGRGTFLEGAALVIDQPPGSALCLNCGSVVAIHPGRKSCPSCAGDRLEPREGKMARFVDMEVA